MAAAVVTAAILLAWELATRCGPIRRAGAAVRARLAAAAMRWAARHSGPLVAARLLVAGVADWAVAAELAAGDPLALARRPTAWRRGETVVLWARSGGREEPGGASRSDARPGGPSERGEQRGPKGRAERGQLAAAFAHMRREIPTARDLVDAARLFGASTPLEYVVAIRGAVDGAAAAAERVAASIDGAAGAVRAATEAAERLGGGLVRLACFRLEEAAPDQARRGAPLADADRPRARKPGPGRPRPQLWRADWGGPRPADWRRAFGGADPFEDDAG